MRKSLNVITHRAERGKSLIVNHEKRQGGERPAEPGHRGGRGPPAPVRACQHPQQIKAESGTPMQVKDLGQVGIEGSSKGADGSHKRFGQSQLITSSIGLAIS